MEDALRVGVETGSSAEEGVDGVQAWMRREGPNLLLAWTGMLAEGSTGRREGVSINSMEGWGTVAWSGVPSPFGGGRL